ncbi:hypothetical protein ScPMuIL_002611 [Solemya velum]
MNTGDAKRMETCQSCRSTEAVDTFNFCKTCVKIVCGKCRSEKHGHHEIDSVAVVATEVRDDSSDYTSSQNTRGKLAGVQQVEQLAQNFEEQLLAHEAKQIDRIKSHFGSLHDLLNQICDALVQNVADVVRDDMKLLKKIEKDAKKLAASITAMCDSAKQIIREADDMIAVTRGYALCEDLKEALTTEITTPTRSPAFNLQFLPGTPDRTGLEVMCGQISVTTGDGNGTPASTTSGQSPPTKISMASGDSSGTQAGAGAGQSPPTKVSAPTSPGRSGAASSKVVTGLKRTRTFSVSAPVGCEYSTSIRPGDSYRGLNT